MRGSSRDRSPLELLAVALLAATGCGPQVTAPPPDPAAAYAIVDTASGECLQPAGGSTAAGAEIALAACGPSSAQHFVLATSGGYGTIRNAASGLCLEVGDATAPLAQAVCSGAVSQVFATLSTGDAFTIFAEQTGLVLSAREGRLEQSRLTGAASQQFRLVGTAAGP
jgi:hypothetical protein